jgi:hypothetical protein
MSLPGPPTLGDSGPGHIDAGVLARGARPANGLAQDYAFRDYLTRWLR